MRTVTWRPTPTSARSCSRSRDGAAVPEAGAGAGRRSRHRGRPGRPARPVADRHARVSATSTATCSRTSAARRSSIPDWRGARRVARSSRASRRPGIPMRRVHTVIVTHSHPDHFGAAGWVRHETGADIVTHRRFRLMWDPSEPPDVDVEDVVDGVRRQRRRLCRSWRVAGRVGVAIQAAHAVGSGAVGRVGDDDPVPAQGTARSCRSGSRACCVSRCRPSASTTPGRSASPAATGWRCTPLVTPRTTCACSTRPTA